ncbi:MAG: hypothetical protein DRP54_08800 [Spirochaetes bacterium]|nr:MAG: hypothetical protein DRP54_08800 [Spirochaetota bacterium]
MKYRGLVIEGLCIPYVVLENFGEGLSPEKVKISYNDEMFELSEPLKSYMEETVARKQKEAEEKGRKFFDGPQVRLVKVRYNRENGEVELELQRTSFFRYACSNRSMDRTVEEKRIRELYVNEDDLRNLDDGLSNSIGVDIGLLTSDKKIILTQRSKKLHQYPGLYGVPAGFMSPKDKYTQEKYSVFDIKDEMVSPFVTAVRELYEEVNVQDSSIPKNMRLIEIGRAYDDMHPEIIVFTQTDATGEDVKKLAKFARDKFEGPPVPVPFNPRDVARYMVESVKEIPPGTPKIEGLWIPGKSPLWVPAHWRTVYLLLEREFGSEEANKELKRILNI